MPAHRLSHSTDVSSDFRPWTWEESNAIYRLIPDAGRRQLADTALRHLRQVDAIDRTGQSPLQPERSISTDEVSCEILHHIIPSGEFLVVLDQHHIDCTELAERWNAKHRQCGGCTYGL